MRPIYLLWLDSDAPRGNRTYKNCQIRSVASCNEAVKLLRHFRPDIIVVNLIARQDGWQAHQLHILPGLELMRHMAFNRIAPAVVVYTIMPTPEIVKLSRESGAVAVYDKTVQSLAQIIDEFDR